MFYDLRDKLAVRSEVDKIADYTGYTDKHAAVGKLGKTTNKVRDLWKKAYGEIRQANYNTATLNKRKLAAETGLPLNELHSKLINTQAYRTYVDPETLSAVSRYKGQLRPSEIMLDSMTNRLTSRAGMQGFTGPQPLNIGKPLTEIPKEARWLASMVDRKNQQLLRQAADLRSAELERKWAIGAAERGERLLKQAERQHKQSLAKNLELIELGRKKDRINKILKVTTGLGAVGTGAGLGYAAMPEPSWWEKDALAAYTGYSPYLTDKKAILGEMRMNVLGEASAARQAAEAARVQPAPTVADTVKATAEKAYTRKKASPTVNPKFFKRMLSTRGGKAALIGGAGLAALGLGGAGYAGYRKYSKPEVPWYLTQGGTAGIGALAGGLMGAGAGYGAAGRPGAGAGVMLGALGGAAAGYYGNDMIRGYVGY